MAKYQYLEQTDERIGQDWVPHGEQMDERIGQDCVPHGEQTDERIGQDLNEKYITLEDLQAPHK